MIVPDEVVIDALLKDAQRFKNRWEITGTATERQRVKPNVDFLQRHMSNLVKTNKNRMRQPKLPEDPKPNKECGSSTSTKRSPTPKKSFEEVSISKASKATLKRKRPKKEQKRKPKKQKKSGPHLQIEKETN